MKKPIDVRTLTQTHVSKKDAIKHGLKIFDAIDDNGNKVEMASVNQSEYIGRGKFKLPNGKIANTDFHEMPFELKNLNKQDIILENCHPDPAIKNTFFQKIVLKPNQWCFLPHDYFIPWLAYVGNKDGLCRLEKRYGGNNVSIRR